MNVPIDFQPHHPFEYPANNHLTFEEWFATQSIPETERTYLPVFWTSYYCKHQYGKNPRKQRNLQQFINSLDKSKSYYTIVQYDDGILNSLNNIDIKVFGMGGGRIDFPLPLISQPHPYDLDTKKEIFASFFGANNHPIRDDIRHVLNNEKYLISTKKVPIIEYCETMAKSIFALCPRGYGLSSFRICEALQYGAIPVYISDKFIIPFNRDFDDYGITINSDQIHLIDKILSGIPLCDVKKKQMAGRKAYEEMFTYEGCYKLILENI